MKDLGIEIFKCLKEVLIEVYKYTYKFRPR